MYTNAPARTRIAAAPIATPAIAPPERFECDPAAAAAVGVLENVGVVVTVVAITDDADVEVEERPEDVLELLSEGKYSPGLNINVEFLA